MAPLEREGIKLLPFYMLFTFADTTDKILMVIGTFSAVVNGACVPLMTIIFGELIDTFGKTLRYSDPGDMVSKVAVKFVYLAVPVGVAASLQVMCWMVTGERQAARMRNLYLKAIITQDIAFFDRQKYGGDVVGQMSGDAVHIQDAMGEKVGKFIQLMSTFVGGFVVAFLKGWLLTLAMLSCIPVVVIATGVASVMISKTSITRQAAYEKAAIVAEQTLGSIRTVASFTGEKQALAKYNKAIENGFKSGVHEGLATGFGVGASCLALYGSYALSVWFGAKMIVERGYTGGTVVNVIVAFVAGSLSLGQAAPCLPAFSAGQAAASKMFETINRNPEIDVSDTSGRILDDIDGDIELKAVDFSYPARPDEQIFRGFSIFIRSGKVTALVGQSGSGKSSVISLIERFYDPQGGQVLVDGVDLKELQLKWIRSKIGLVSQEPVLFASSIRENIAYGKEAATDEEIRAAAELANAASFIDELPMKLETLVGEKGIQLSGGQKQRVAIARAILKNPRILLLDEATSALDAKSERVVQDALDRVMVNRTTVVVAHRLSTIQNADMIAVIHQGKVVEKGNHTQLLQDPEGPYSMMIRLQEMKQDSKHPKISVGGNNGSCSLPHMDSMLHNVTASMSTKAQDTNLPLDESKDHPKASIRRLASLNKPEVPELFIGTIIAMINGCIPPIFGILMSRVIRVFYEPPHQLKQDSRFWALMFLVLGVGLLLAYIGRSYFFAVAGAKLLQRIRCMCFEKVIHMEIGWFDQPRNISGVISAKLSSDAAAVRVLVGDALGLLVQNMATGVAGLVVAFTANWELSFIILVIVPLIGINGFVQIKSMKGFGEDTKQKYEDASQIANDAVRSIRTVASFGVEDKVLKLYEDQCKGPIRMGIRMGVVSGLGFGLASAMFFCAFGLCSYAGGQLVKHRRATFTEFFQVFFALASAALVISQSSALVPDTSRGRDSAASIFAILDSKSIIDPSKESGMTLEEVNGDIKLSHVSFRYPTRPDVQIFRDINMDIHAGKTVAIVGESGCGKSTIISLLQRFYEPESGYITLDGIRIQDYQLKWLRQQMGLVSQEPVLFNDSVRSNISYGKAGKATEDEIVAAAKVANAHNFVSALQQGYDTIVGDRGSKLSGGQTQRLAIARAIVKNPKILLLDEATSALDAESERVVQDALDQIMVNRTTIVVAHRLATIKHVDLIAVVKDGVIVEKGTHESLLHVNDGVYASMVALHMSS